MKFVAAVVMLAMLLPAVAAQQLDEAAVNIILVDDKAVVSKEYVFSEGAEFTEIIPGDATAIEVSIDGSVAQLKEATGALLIPAGGAKQVKISYISEKLIEREKHRFFIADIRLPAGAARLTVKVTLPAGAVLTEPLSDTGGSALPKPDRAETDGRFLMFTWERAHADSLPLFISYTTGEGSITVLNFIIAMAVIFAVAAVVISFVLRPEKNIEEPEKKEEFMDSHLKEDEMTVINVLRMKEGSTTQATLRVVTGFSKATLSRILSELEERNIIHKEQQGNKNLVTLREAEWNKLEPEQKG